MSISKKNIIIAVVLIVIALASFSVLAKTFSDPETLKETSAALEAKEDTVLKMSIVSLAAASAIDLIPGDAGKSVSDRLTDLGGYFVLLFAAIYFEKLLITIGGAFAFKILIPIGLLLLAGFFVFNSELLKSVGIKMVSLGLVMFLLVPTSVWVSDAVDKTHEQSKQIAIEEFSEETGIADVKQEEKAEETKTKKGLSAFFNNSKETLSAAATKVKDLPEKAGDLLNNLVEEIAYYFVSICVIPILVLILMVVLVKQILGLSSGGVSGAASMIKELKSIKQELRDSAE